MTTQTRGEETKARLLQAAADCFAQYGYDGASVAEICRCAGVSKGAFYHHFASKHNLFLKLMASWLEIVDQQLESARVASVSMADALSAMAENARPTFEMAEQYIPMVLEFYMQASRDPVVWEATIEPYSRYLKFFAELIEIGVADGSIRPVDPWTAARVLLSMAVGLLLQGMLNLDAQDWGQVAQDGVQMLLEGLKSHEQTL